VVSEDSCGEPSDGAAEDWCPAQMGPQLPGLVAFTDPLGDNGGRL